MSKRKRSIAKTASGLVWRGGALGLFMAVAVTLVFFSLGYRVNFDTRALEQTGAISINGDESSVTVYLDGAAVASKLPYVATTLSPNTTHTVRITKPDYMTWEQTVRVEPGLVTTLGPVGLWLEKPVVLVQAGSADFTSCATKKLLRSDELTRDGGEIRAGSTLITRFSSPIVEACWFRDTNHVVYASQKSVFIIDISVSAISPILSSDQPIVHLEVVRSNQAVLVQFEDKSWKQIIVSRD